MNTIKADRLALAKEMIALYIAAEKAVLTGRTYTIDGQSLGREDLDKIRKGREYWEEELNKLNGITGRKAWRVSFIDD